MIHNAFPLYNDVTYRDSQKGISQKACKFVRKPERDTWIARNPACIPYILQVWEKGMSSILCMR